MTQPTTERASYIRWFRDIALGDVPLVGGKSISLNPDALVRGLETIAAAERESAPADHTPTPLQRTTSRG